VFSTAVFELADGQLDDGVLTVEPVGFDGVQVAVAGDEAVMTPRRTTVLVGAIGEAGAAHEAAIFLTGAAANVGGFDDLRAFLHDDTLGDDDVRSPVPARSEAIVEWVERWAEAEIERGPRYAMEPENRRGLRRAAWRGLVQYGIWSESVASASPDEYRLGVARLDRRRPSPVRR